MPLSEAALTDYLLSVMQGVLEDLGAEAVEPIGSDARFSDALDSMAMVEFLGVVADDCKCGVSAIEECVDQHFSTAEHMARAMKAAGIGPTEQVELTRASAETADGLVHAPAGSESSRPTVPDIWLAGVASRLPRQIQTASELDEAVGRPTGWLKRRAGILQRSVWGSEDPIATAAACAADALQRAQVSLEQLGTLLTVSEAPPLCVGLAAAIHRQLGLRSGTPCFELGGACTGFLSALSLARSLVAERGAVLIVSVEAHSRVLPLSPCPVGESAALFGDGCAAAVLGSRAGEGPGVKLMDLKICVDGSAAEIIRVRPLDCGGFGLEMDGVPLTEFALHALATATREIAAQHGHSVSNLSAIVAHGGNGRMPAMLARLLHLPATKVWSDVARTGNLGSASVPVAWASRPVPAPGPVVWTAVGAGIAWGAALWEIQSSP